MLFFMAIASYFLSSHRVPIPPDAPLELKAAVPFFFPKLFTSLEECSLLQLGFLDQQDVWLVKGD